MAEVEVKGRDGIQANQHRAIAGTQTQLDKRLDIATRGLNNDEEHKSKSSTLKTDLK